MSDVRGTSRDRRDVDAEVQAQAQVVAEHLPTGYTAEFHSDDGATPGSATTASATTPVTEGQETPESSLKLQGGDIHRDLFKLPAATRSQMHRRAATFHNPREFHQDEDAPGLTVGDQLAPGGFRRAFLHQRHGNDFVAARLPITRNFVEFLDLYGSFAGEDLVDTDEEAITEEEEAGEGEDEEAGAGERRPLLRPRASSRAPRNADAGTVKTFFTLLKAFVGTGIMFLPKAFNNGGILFSSIAMIYVSAITMVAFHLLLQCKLHYGGGYGEIGNAIAGPRMRALVLFSIALSQIGFVCAGIVFVAENLMTFFHAVTGGHSPFTSAGLIAMQVVVLVPLAWIRNISKLGPIALLADACILIGVGYIYWYTTSSLTTVGPDPTVVLFNPAHYTMTIGAAIFTFEGIGLILPIQSSMAQPEHFEPLLGVVMLLITVVFTSVGAVCYATFGEHTQIEIINNFPQDSALVNTVQVLYAIAVLAGTPVQLFPALRIVEGKIFGHMRSGKGSLRTKWTKNAFRFGVVVFCGLVSVAGTGNLDRFVALIGSVACVPLVYVYPAYLHWKGVATKRWVKWGDIALMVLGMVGMVYTSTVTIVNSFL
ncbi:transmembrane amino acid transporter protein-domain-containing protein [Dichotomopilus funicola]|uniref:Transmembrane amino acid transporter protein-domain-containing protein n=1 Tax=Dichotomopilus funicola TaxID=1934379 RepID=A0AAN6V1J9_9PEZI|nr:transmembrane amino acid transporter protein-domain-containing protein [Dichotomopilus funicola]